MTEEQQDIDFIKVMKVIKNKNNSLKHIGYIRRYINLYCEKYNDWMLENYFIQSMYLNIIKM